MDIRTEGDRVKQVWFYIPAPELPASVSMNLLEILKIHQAKPLQFIHGGTKVQKI